MAVQTKPHRPSTAVPARARRPRFARPRLVPARNLVQAAFALFLLYSGWRFYLFVQHFANGGRSPFVPRPASVDAFLPIGALVALRAWLGGFGFDRVHPAALVLLVAILTSALLFRRGFCSWVCPIGALEEGLARLGQMLAGRNFLLPAFLDWPLRAIKYLVLAFFLKAVLLDMSPLDAWLFSNSDYSKVVDVRMLYFFSGMGQSTAIVLLALAFLSVPFANFWCRYLCPYGGLAGLLGWFSPLQIVRNPERCTACGRCTRACPNRLDVAHLKRVASPECTGCLDCLAACRRRGALDLRLPRQTRPLDPWLFPVLLIGTLLAAVLVAQVLGYWQSDISYDTYARLIPLASGLTH